MRPLRRTHEESNYSAAEDLRMRIKQTTCPKEREAIEEELEGLDAEELETFTQSLYNVIK